jgi:hypothetical protein
MCKEIQIIKSDLKTYWDYIPNIKQFEFYSHMNWFQVKTQLTTFTQFNINIIKTQLSN